MSTSRRALRRIGVAAAVFGLLLIILVAWYVVPILWHSSGGWSGQSSAPASSSVQATGSDGRIRSLDVVSEDGGPYDLSAAHSGDRVVVHGSGYDESTGIYVAVCRIADDPSQRPTPCIGGVPEYSEAEASDAWSASAWINGEAKWRLFGASSWGSDGSFEARLTLSSADSSLDCTVEKCAIYTRADHTALGDRRQDLYLPVVFAD